MVVILKRAAASLVVGASLLGGAAQAQLPCWDAATQPVRQFFQERRYGAGEMQRAMDEIRLNERRVALERKTQLLAREYAEYNADVTAYLHYNFARQPNTSLYLPQPPGLTDPSTGAPCESCPHTPSVPAGGATPQNRHPADPGPAVHRLPQVYPPVPPNTTQVHPQPNGVYHPLPREQSLMWNGNSGYIPAYTAQQPSAYGY